MAQEQENNFTDFLYAHFRGEDAYQVDEIVSEIRLFCNFFNERYRIENKEYGQFFADYKCSSNIQMYQELYDWVKESFNPKSEFVWECLNVYMNAFYKSRVQDVLGFLISITLLIEGNINPLMLLPNSVPNRESKTPLKSYEMYEPHVLGIVNDLIGDTVPPPQNFQITSDLIRVSAYIYNNDVLTGPSDRYLEKLINDEKFEFKDLPDNTDNLVLLFHESGYAENKVTLIISGSDCTFSKINREFRKFDLVNSYTPLIRLYRNVLFMINTNNNIRELVLALTKARYRQGITHRQQKNIE